ncbi:MAG: dihydroorotase [Candidatus Kapaibacteriales bacterium]
MKILLKDIRTINPIQQLDDKLNIFILDGIIEYVGKYMPQISEDTKIIEGYNLVCSPGLFDMHVHFRDPGHTYKESLTTGIQSAANGGFTGVLCMPNTNPPIDNVQMVEYIINRTKGEIVDVFPASAITQGQKGEKITPFYSLAEAGALMFTDDGTSVMNSEVMRRAFDYAATNDLLLGQHCEDLNLTRNFSINEGIISSVLGLKGYPSVAEEIILSRDLMLAKYCGNRRYHAQHISTANSVALIRQAKKQGLRVTCEVTPHHFTLSEELLETYDTNYKMNPPLRTKEDIEAILKGLADGTIDCIATDHAPHRSFEKDVELEKAPNGVIGLETALGLSLTYLYHAKMLSLSEIINKLSVNPRKILGLEPIKIQKSSSANLTIFSIDEEWIVDKQFFKSKSKNTPFEGLKLKGKPKYVINNKQLFICNL